MELIDYMITCHKDLAIGLNGMNQGQDSFDKLAKILAKSHEDEAIILLGLKNLIIREQKQPNCKHPKNMRDKCGDKWYCMNCNADLNY